MTREAPSYTCWEGTVANTRRELQSNEGARNQKTNCGVCDPTWGDMGQGWAGAGYGGERWEGYRGAFNTCAGVQRRLEGLLKQLPGRSQDRTKGFLLRHRVLGCIAFARLPSMKQFRVSRTIKVSTQVREFSCKGG